MQLEAIKDSKTESQEKNYMFNRIDISSKGKTFTVVCLNLNFCLKQWLTLHWALGICEQDEFV